MHPYISYLQTLAQTPKLQAAVPPPQPRPRAQVRDNAPLVVICSPHPDDECIIGALPYRLLRENGWRVRNIAITLGSNQNRREARRAELIDACHYLGFELEVVGKEGFSNVLIETRRAQPKLWMEMADELAARLSDLNPAIIVFPHNVDFNPTHLGVHLLVRHAMWRLGNKLSCWCLETEFWAAMDTPNLMVEVPLEDLAELMGALSLHRGEVARNPYHWSLPAWMVDNVRRGSELLAGAGNPAQPFSFATLYHLARWHEGTYSNALPSPLFINSNESAEHLLSH